MAQKRIFREKIKNSFQKNPFLFFKKSGPFSTNLDVLRKKSLENRARKNLKISPLRFLFFLSIIAAFFGMF